ncbi:MAG TPA: D-glucuronyl C5-epimerase family protein [Thermoleophilaceae bacterium]|nr:D-glucuronyl C5-epimerase family protein [Thermoleophilaceae bacterium]
MRVPLAALVILAAGAAPAAAAPVLAVGPDRTVLRDDPHLPPRATSDLPPPPDGASAQRGRPAATLRGGRRKVRRALARALDRGQITPAEHDEWRAVYREALDMRQRLAGARQDQLSAVIETLEDITVAGGLKASRMPALFLQLARNTEYWPDEPYPASGQRVVFAGSRIVFQHYAGQGLQIQPLANFGKANALWRDGHVNRLRGLVDELVAIASRRAGFTTWEYWFEFGGGSPPWTSAMAQGTAIQALTRASDLLADPSYGRVARRAVGAFRKRAPRGVRVRGMDGGNHYLIYSFSKGLRVLNAFAQSLTGLYDYAAATGEDRALELFEAGDRSLRAELPRYDTGAWTLYSLGGAEATLEYHELATGFMSNLCDRLADVAHCDAAARFERYTRESPRLRLRTHRLVEDGPRRVRFRLSKGSTVRITISRRGSVVHSASAYVPYGIRSFAWVPPRPGEYVVTLAAESFDGTRGSTSGTIIVRERP